MCVRSDRYGPTFHISVGAFAYVAQRCIVEEALPIQNAVSACVARIMPNSAIIICNFRAEFAQLVSGSIDGHPARALDQSHYSRKRALQTPKEHHNRVKPDMTALLIFGRSLHAFDTALTDAPVSSAADHVRVACRHDVHPTIQDIIGGADAAALATLLCLGDLRTLERVFVWA
jgi:hypothetical protein